MGQIFNVFPTLALRARDMKSESENIVNVHVNITRRVIVTCFSFFAVANTKSQDRGCGQPIECKRALRKATKKRHLLSAVIQYWSLRGS